MSGRNQLRGYIEEVRVEGLLAQVRLRIGDQRLTAVITRDAVDELKLRRGDEALAVVKATEVMIAREASRPPRAPAARVDSAIADRLRSSFDVFVPPSRAPSPPPHGAELRVI